MSGPLLLVCDDPGLGGCAAVARALWRGLSATREVVLATDLGAALPGHFSEAELAGKTPHKLVHHPVDERRTHQSTFGYLPALDLLERVSPSLVEFHDSRALTSMLALKRAAWLRRTPFIAVQHLVPPGFDGAPEGGPWSRRWVDKAARIAFVGQENLERFVHRVPGAARKAVLAPNGVPDTAPTEAAPSLRAEIGAGPESRVVLLLARLHPDKGQDVAIRALAGLRRAAPADDVRLVLAGPDAGFAEALKRLARELGVEDRVVFLGWRPDGRSLLRQADVALQLGRAEGLPLSMLEAMAEGTPLVAAGAGDVALALAGGAGLLVEAGDAEGSAAAVSDALTTVLGDAQLSRTLRSKARARYEERYSLDAMTERHRRMIEEVEQEASRRGRPRAIKPPPLPARYTVDMSRPPATWGALGEGWGGWAPPWGVVSYERCDLELRLPERREPGAARLAFDVVVPGLRLGRWIEVSIEGARPVSWLFLGAHRRSRRTVVVPLPEPGRDRLRISFRVRAFGLSPRPLPVSDGRRLGFWLQRIGVEVLSGAEAQAASAA